MKKLLGIIALTILTAGFLAGCSKEVKKDNSAEHEATRKAAEKSVKELDKE